MPAWQTEAMATMADLDELALALPGTSKTVAEDGRPTYLADGKAFACTIQFLGGRRGDVTIFGDKQIFVVPLEGKVSVIETGEYAVPIRWIR